MMRQARRTVDGGRRRGMASTTCRRVGWFGGDGSLVKDGGEESQNCKVEIWDKLQAAGSGRQVGARMEFHFQLGASEVWPCARCTGQRV